MDKLVINSGFVRALASKLLDNVIKKRFNVNAETRLNELQITFQEGSKAHAHISIDADMTASEMTRLLASIGL